MCCFYSARKLLTEEGKCPVTDMYICVALCQFSQLTAVVGQYVRQFLGEMGKKRRGRKYEDFAF